MKKVISMVLLCVLLAAVCSCAQSTEESFYTDFIGDTALDFNGYEAHIIEYCTDDCVFMYTANHLIGDMIKQRIIDIKDKYNLNIVLDSVGDANKMLALISGAVASGTHDYDMVYTSTSNVLSNYCYNGWTVPYTVLSEYVDTNDYDKYGTPNLYELAMLDGEPYAVFPMYWPEKSATGFISNICVINENLLQRYNLDDPREMFENGEWTTAKLEEITPLYTQQDGERTIKTLTGHINGLARSILTCNGHRSIVKENGQLKSGFLSEGTKTMIDWANNYITMYAENLTLNEDWHSGVPLVAGETMIALSEPMYIITDIAPYLENFGCVPFPTGPDVAVDDYGTIIVAMEGMSVLSISNSPEACGLAIDELFEPFEGYETEEQRIDYLYKSIFFDRRDAELYYSFAKSAVYDYWTVGGNAIHNYISSNLGTQTSSQMFEACETMLDSVIEKYISTNYEYMNEYYSK